MLKLLMVPQFLIAYLILCVIAGMLGRNKVIGFWGYFLLSIVITPIVPMLFMLIGRPRAPRPARHEQHERHEQR